jgi:hypothetical protein
LPVLVPDLHLGCPWPKSNLLETINFSAGHLYLPPRATKWSPGSESRRRQVCQGDWSKRDNPRTHRLHVDLCAVEFRKHAETEPSAASLG